MLGNGLPSPYGPHRDFILCSSRVAWTRFFPTTCSHLALSKILTHENPADTVSIVHILKELFFGWEWPQKVRKWRTEAQAIRVILGVSFWKLDLAISFHNISKQIYCYV